MVCFLGIAVANCAAVSINFDTDAAGNPLVVTGSFASNDPLTTLYTPLGVTFSGPSALDGGAILNQSGNFGVNARSTPNFLAFNRNSSMQNGGVPRDPETLTFSPPVSDASIYASGGGAATSFRMEAFDAGGSSLGFNTGASAIGAYVQLSVASATPIARVVLTEIGGDPHFVYDDLNFTPIPEPGSLSALALGLSLLRRKR
jgi:hypothetical protein